MSGADALPKITHGGRRAGAGRRYKKAVLRAGPAFVTVERPDGTLDGDALAPVEIEIDPTSGHPVIRWGDRWIHVYQV